MFHLINKPFSLFNDSGYFKASGIPFHGIAKKIKPKLKRKSKRNKKGFVSVTLTKN